MEDLQTAYKSYIFNTYARLPVVFVRGKACTLWDENGKEYRRVTDHFLLSLEEKC